MDDHKAIDQTVDMPRVTAVVVNWNAGNYLRPCVQALMSISHPELDILVVDNDSTDDSLGTLEDLGDRIRLVRAGQNLGFGSGINRGVQSSSSPFVLVLNPDVILEDDSVKEMDQFLEAKPTVGAVGPKLLDASGKPIASCGSVSNSRPRCGAMARLAPPSPRPAAQTLRAGSTLRSMRP